MKFLPGVWSLNISLRTCWLGSCKTLRLWLMSLGRQVCRTFLRCCRAEASMIPNCCRTLRYSSARSTSNNWKKINKYICVFQKRPPGTLLLIKATVYWFAWLVVYLLQLPEQTPQNKFLDWIGNFKNKPLQGHRHVIHCEKQNKCHALLCHQEIVYENIHISLIFAEGQAMSHCIITRWSQMIRNFRQILQTVTQCDLNGK